MIMGEINSNLLAQKIMGKIIHTFSAMSMKNGGDMEIEENIKTVIDDYLKEIDMAQESD